MQTADHHPYVLDSRVTFCSRMGESLKCTRHFSATLKVIQVILLGHVWCGPLSHRIWTVANLVRWGQIFSKRFCLTICLVELFIDQKEVFLDTKANFGPEFALTIVDIHCRGISLLVIWHVNSVPFGICWPIWRGQEKYSALQYILQSHVFEKIPKSTDLTSISPN